MKDLFFKRIAQTSSSPLGLQIEKADGVFLYSKKAKYFDLISGVSVSNIGHGNKKVIEAIKKQVDDYSHLMVYGEIIQSPQVLFADKLASLLPGLDTVYFVNSGSEANEAALKLAKRITGRKEMISCVNAYHGSTHGALSMMGGDFFKTAFEPLLPGVSHIRFNEIDDLKQINENTACVLIEPIQGEGGVIMPEGNYLRCLRERCDEVGSLLIFDEVQVAFGRTGSMFAFEKYGVKPDILTLAKALGGGMPLGALIASASIMEAWKTNPPLGHITTFGGHPISCAAGLAALNVLQDENLISEVEKKSKLYVDGLIDHPLVKEIRAAGLLIAIDMGEENFSSEIIPLLLEEGIVSDYFLFHPTSFRIAPPLSISVDEIKDSIVCVKKAMDKLLNKNNLEENLWLRDNYKIKK